MPVTFDIDGSGTALLAAVKARRLQLKADAPCDSCGTALARCDELKTLNTDPTAPPWFGCCATGLDPRPCRHRPDPEAVETLMEEWESGRVRTVAEMTVTTCDQPQPASLEWLLQQREWWRPQRGPMARIAEMADTHRYHLLGWLERKAGVIARVEADRLMWSTVGIPEKHLHVVELIRTCREVLERPVETVMATPLYQALLASMPAINDGKAWASLLARSEHWSTCPASRDLAAPCDLRWCGGDDTFDEASGQGLL